MSKDISASVPDQALAVPAEPANGLGPSGFDPSRTVITHAGDSACVAWRAIRNAALHNGSKLPGWEAQVHTFAPRDHAFPNMGGDLFGRAILVGSDRDAVEQAAAAYPATSRQLFEHGGDLLYRGEIAA